MRASSGSLRVSRRPPGRWCRAVDRTPGSARRGRARPGPALGSVGGVSVPVDPRPVVIAGLLVVIEAVGVLVLAVVNVLSGLSSDSPIGRNLAQGAYYVVLALLLLACASGVLRGR